MLYYTYVRAIGLCCVIEFINSPAWSSTGKLCLLLATSSIVR